jgi:two-component system, response regulator
MEKLNSIIVVDDDEGTLELLKYWITRKKITSKIYTFLHVSEAVDFVKGLSDGSSLWPGLILLDLYLPGENGLELLEVLSSFLDKPKPKIFIVTASENMKDLQAASVYDIDAFIKKPITQKKLDGIFSQIFNTEK